MNHSKGYIERNVACCDKMLVALDYRISVAKQTGEDVKELRKEKTGYNKTRANLLKE